MIKIKRALISVTDKSGLGELAEGLAGFGVELVSTGGTARAIRESGAEVIDVAQVTGFPEMLEGRVKTLHPKIHGGILARRDSDDHLAQLDEAGIGQIDLVVVNLYQFEKAVADPGCGLEEAIENIDIGGPTLIRASAKNWTGVAIITDPADYKGCLDEMKASGGSISRPTRWCLAKKAFALTAAYDAAITQNLPRWD
jgi:phosphoribosylaminoimidazolecarboxamide formyltransferase / IMP cyclohydrolase